MANDTVQTAIYRLGYETKDSVQQLKQTDQAVQAVVKSTEQLSVSEEKVTRATRSATGEMERLLAKLDPTVRAEQQLQRTLEQVNRLQNEGVGSTQQHTRAVELAEEKFRKLTAANDNFATSSQNATKSTGAFTDMLGLARTGLAAFGVTLGVAGLVQFGRSVLNTAANLSEQAEQLGLNVVQMQAYRASLVVAGGSMDQADRIFARFADRLGSLREGNEAVAKSFDKIGLSAADLDGEPTEAMAKFAQAAMRIEDEQRRVALINDVLGEKLGGVMIPVLKDWAKGADEVTAAAKRLGVVVEEDLGTKADAAADKLTIAFARLRTEATPAVVALTEAIANFVTGLSKIPDKPVSGILEALGLPYYAHLYEQATGTGPGTAPFAGPRVPAADYSGRATAPPAGQASTNWTQFDTAMAFFNNPSTKELEEARRAREKATQEALREQEQFADAIVAIKVATNKAVSDLADKQLKEEADARQETLKRERELEEAKREQIKLTNKLEVEMQQAADRAAKESADSVQRYWDDIGRSVSDSFHRFFDDIFIDGEISFGNLWKSIKSSFGQMLSDMATQALVQPIIMPIVQSFQGFAGSFGGGIPIPGGIAGPNGVPTYGSAAGAASGIGGLGNMLGLGLGSLGTMGGIFGSTGAGISAGFGTGIGAGTLSMAPVSTAGILGGTAGLAGVLGAAGLGALGGGMFASLIGGNQTGGSIGGGIGAALGMMTPLGPLGALLGGLAGSAIGGMFGNNEPSNYTAFANFGSDFSLVGGLSGDKPNQATLAAAAQAGQAISEAAKLLEAAGIELASNVMRLRIGQRDTSKLQLSTGGFIDVGPAGDVEAAVKGTLNYLLQNATSSNATVQQVLSSWSGRGGVSMENLEQIISDIDFATGLENLSFVEEKLTASEQVLKAITEQFEAAITRAQELGIETAKVEEARDRAIAKLRDDANAANQEAIDTLVNPTAAAWHALARMQEERMKEMQALGADVALLERRNLLERQEFLKNLNEEQRAQMAGLVDFAEDLTARIRELQAVALTAIDEQIREANRFANEMRALARQYEQSSSSLGAARNGFLVGNLSPLSPIGQYQESRTQLESLRSLALSGNIDALRDLPGAAQTFLQHSLNVNASTSAYGADFSMVQALLDAAKAKSDAVGAGATSAADLAEQQVTLLEAIKETLSSESPDAALFREQLAALDAISAASATMVAQLGLGLNVLDAPTLRSALLDLLHAIDATATPTPVVVPTLPGEPLPGTATGGSGGGMVQPGSVIGANGQIIDYVPDDILAAFGGDRNAALAFLASVGSANPLPYPSQHSGIPQDLIDLYGSEQAYHDAVAGMQNATPPPGATPEMMAAAWQQANANYDPAVFAAMVEQFSQAMGQQTQAVQQQTKAVDQLVRTVTNGFLGSFFKKNRAA